MLGAFGGALDHGHVDAFFFKEGFQVEAGRARLLRCDRFRRADRDDVAAFDAAIRPQVDDPVGGLDDVEVVFDDDGAFESRALPLNPRCFPQRLVHARLPAGALGAEGGDDVLV